MATACANDDLDPVECAHRHTLHVPGARGAAAVSVHLGVIALVVTEASIAVFALPTSNKSATGTFAHLRTIPCVGIVTTLAFTDGDPGGHPLPPLLLVGVLGSSEVLAMDVTAEDARDVVVGSFSIDEGAGPDHIATKGDRVLVLHKYLKKMCLFRAFPWGPPAQWEHLRTLEWPRTTCCLTSTPLDVTYAVFAHDSDGFIMHGFCRECEVRNKCHRRQVSEFRVQSKKPVLVARWSETGPVSFRPDLAHMSFYGPGSRYGGWYLLTYSGIGFLMGGRHVGEGCVQCHHPDGSRKTLIPKLKWAQCAQYVDGLGIVVTDSSRVQVFMTQDQMQMDAMTIHRVAWMVAVAKAILTH